MKRTVLVTGATSGIGRTACAAFARRGWSVAATGRDLDRLPRGEDIAAWRLDVTDEGGIAPVIDAVVATFGRIDALVNNAGFGIFGPLEGATAAQVDAQFRTNVSGAIAMIRHVLPVMRRQGGGTIVNISSIGGRFAAPLASLYHATKFAIEGLSDSLRHELAPFAVRVKLVEPGHFKTGFVANSLVTPHPDYADALQNYMEWVRLEDERAPGPEPVAAAIVRAAEDRSARLRYPVKGAATLALARVLPDAMWRSLFAAGMRRGPRKRAASPAAGGRP